MAHPCFRLVSLSYPSAGEGASSPLKAFRGPSSSLDPSGGQVVLHAAQGAAGPDRPQVSRLCQPPDRAPILHAGDSVPAQFYTVAVEHYWSHHSSPAVLPVFGLDFLHLLSILYKQYN